MNKTVILLLLSTSSVCSAIAHMVFKKTSGLGWCGLLSYYGIIAFLLYGLGFLLYYFSLRHIELSIAGQFIVLTYVLVCLASYFAFNEAVTGKQIAGITMVAIGMFAVLGE